MAVNVSLDMTELYDADANTDWAGDDDVTEYAGWQREGSNCLGSQVSAGAGEFFKTISSTDLTNTHIYSWMFISGQANTEANGGFRIVVGDSSNRRAYYVGGSDNMGFQVGVWSCFVMSTADLPTNYAQELGVGAPDFSAVTRIGVGFDLTNKAVGTADNVFWDICRYGNGLVIGGGTEEDPGTFAEIAADDASLSEEKAYGVVRTLQTGVYGIQGSLTFGDPDGTDSTYFKDTNAIVVFEDRPVASDFYKLTASGNGTGTNTLILGTKSGDVGITGCTIMAAASGTRVDLSFGDTNTDVMKLYGCKFFQCGTTELPTTDEDKEVVSCVWDSCEEVLASTCALEHCQFINAVDGGGVYRSGSG